MTAQPHDTGREEIPTDAIALLQADHREIEHLFFRLEPGGALGSREVFERLSEVLSVHSSIEKEVFYPAIQQSLAGGDNLAKDALFEHKDAELSLERLHRVPMDGDEFTVELLALASKVREHVRMEEDEIFPALRKAVGREVLADLADRLTQAARHAPTRPHPHAPSSAMGAKIAGRLVAPVDRLRGFLRDRL